MHSDPVYVSAPRPTVFAEGIEFQDYVCAHLAHEHIILQNLSSKKYQMMIGENLQGFEIKLDLRCTDTNRLSIEVAEKRDAAHDRWTPSGVCRNDNSWLYIQGNYHLFFIFGKNQLLRYFKKNPHTDESHGTVRKFYLPFSDAEIMALKIMDFR